MSPSGKAAGFDPAIRRFESFHPSHFGDIAAYSGEARLDGETMALFTGNANPALAQEIARHLMVPLGRSVVGRFSDGEVNVELMENVRGRDVFLVQPTCPPVNDSPCLTTPMSASRSVLLPQPDSPAIPRV